MAITNMPIGVADGIEVTISRSFGELEIPHGAEFEYFFLETEIGISTTNQLCGSAGIKLNTSLGSGGSGNLMTVGLTEEERVVMKKVPRNPGVSLELQDGRLLKALEACFMILGHTHTVALSGRGVPILGESDQGTKPGAKTFESAHGTKTITSHENALVKPLSETKPATNSPYTWTAELSCYINNASPSVHPLSLPAEIAALIPGNTIYVIQHGLTLSELPNTPSETYSITAHPTV